MSRQRTFERRHVLGATGSIALLSLAGCIGGDDDGDDEAENGDDGTDDDENGTETNGDDENGDGENGDDDGDDENGDDDGDDENGDDDGDDEEGTDETTIDSTLDVVVYDADGATVEGATVRIENGEELEDETNEHGGVNFSGLEEGEYTIEAEADGESATDTYEVDGIGNSFDITIGDDEDDE